jgi:hypothetical protein
MPNTEPEYSGTLTKLALISERAQQEPKCQFTSLAHLLNAQFLRHCYFQLGRDRASGMDGVTWQEYGENLEENLKDLVARLKAKRYKPQPATGNGPCICGLCVDEDGDGFCDCCDGCIPEGDGPKRQRGSRK